jgi:predicted ArsR family transcriptional regulator
MSAIVKPRPVAPSLLPIIVRLADQGPQQTAADLGTDSIRMGRLVAAGLVRRVESADVKSGKRGRPAHRYSLTDTGRRRVKAARKATQTQEA